jgi:hypothetical protein
MLRDGVGQERHIQHYLFDITGFGLPRLNITNRIFFITSQDNQVWLTSDCHIASFYGKAILTFLEKA